MFDFLHEILATIRRNRMRTLLTGFAVAWGIFMLIVLLGAGNGLRNGVMSNFAGEATNGVCVSTGRTSRPYGGWQAGRRIVFDERDIDLLRSRVAGIAHISPSGGYRFGDLSNGREYTPCMVSGVGPDMQYVHFRMQVAADKGRFINDMDVAMRRKVIVINSAVARALFGDEDPVGRFVEFDGMASFQVVGVFEASWDREVVHIPISTARAIFSSDVGYTDIEFTVDGLDSAAEIEAFDEELRGLLAGYHKFDPADPSAVYIYNAAWGARSMRMVFGGVRIFVLITGIASMMAGIVGVGNIMLITVKERTREIGIRKAIGATPRSILRLVILEAVFIMTVSGYAGIVAGVGLTEIAGRVMGEAGVGDGGEVMFKDPTVDLGIVVGATLFLIACGTAAGLIPALRATRIRPIEAMRNE
jgi:putative ABC transport system permease protein